MRSQQHRKDGDRNEQAHSRLAFQAAQERGDEHISVVAQRSAKSQDLPHVRTAGNQSLRDIAGEAREVIERSIEDPDISPALIASTLGISVRTLHRSFSTSNESVMSLVRRRRMQKAHEDLVQSDDIAKVSEIAARWLFSDASHFIRNFKSIYGATPAAYLKSLENSRDS
ncbi:helix-turn-helix transcriptional regulator [Streptomyces sp. NPDC058394]|uniref:helix-turn-helix transcriptional regulator n=1 Tax=Streptomyces sp. NPDC058394 TaxID=3346477 RepID=UPI00364B021F